MLHVEIQTSTVTGTSASFSTNLDEGHTYILTSTVDLWFKEGGTASVSGTNCVLVGAGVPYPIRALADAALHIIKDTDAATGRATLTRVKP